MGLLQRVTERAVDRLIADQSTSPDAIERSAALRRSIHIQNAAKHWAASALEDQTAANALAEEIQDRGEPLQQAVEYFADRDNFLYDRAYRLLTAVAEHGVVRPVDPTMRNLIDAEERLGRLPLSDAFAWLAEREPRLRDVEKDILRRRAQFTDNASQQALIDAAVKARDRWWGSALEARAG